MNSISRTIYLLVGVVSLVVGVIGVFIPLLPTTPFVLVAAFCFSKSSERLHRWLNEHRVFGPTLKDWQEQRVIRPRAKILATVSVILSMSYPFFFRPMPSYLRVCIGVIAVSVVTFILTRPSGPARNE